MKRKGLISLFCMIFVIISLINSIEAINIRDINKKINIFDSSQYDTGHQLPDQNLTYQFWYQIQGEVSIGSWGNSDYDHEVYVCAYDKDLNQFLNGETIWIDINNDGKDDFTAYLINFRQSDPPYEGPVNLTLINNNFKIVKVNDHEKNMIIPVNGYYHTTVERLNHAKNIDILVERIENHPPKIPNILGNKHGTKGKKYIYTANTTDEDNDKIYYMFDWDNGNKSEWLGPYNSGKIVKKTYIWEKSGNYNVKVKAKDEHNAESDWSGQLDVVIIKNKQYNSIFIQLFDFLVKIFDILNQIF